MRLRPRSLAGIPVGLLLLLVSAPICAQENLLTNPSLRIIDGWDVADLTAIQGFPPSGGVDLITTNPGAGGLGQCIDDYFDYLADENGEIRGGFRTVLYGGNSGGGVLGYLQSYPEPGCTGDPLETTLFEPDARVGTSPADTPIELKTTTTGVPGTASVLFRIFAFQTNPPAEFRFNISDAYLLAGTGTPPMRPDLVITEGTEVLPATRFGPDFNSFSFQLYNNGEAPTSGTWSVTVMAPPGVRLSCPIDAPYECTGSSTSSITITGMTAIEQAKGQVITVVLETVSIEPGNHKITLNASGGGETVSSNNDGEIFFTVAPARDAERATNDAVLSVGTRHNF